MIIQYNGTHLVERSLHRLYLLNDINAIGIIFYHAFNAFDVASRTG